MLFPESLAALQVNVLAAVKAELLDLDDHYAATLTGGRLDSPSTETGPEKTEEGIRYRSPRVQDLSIEFLKSSRYGSSEETTIFGPWGLLGL